MRRYFAPLVLVSIVGCQAETFSPSATFTIEVVSGSIAAYPAPNEPLGPIYLRVMDDQGKSVDGREVTVAVKEGDGTAGLTSSRSGPEGLVVLNWVTGALPGRQRVSVTPLGGEGFTLSTESTGFNASQLAVGQAMSCAIDFDARAWCWGDGWRDGVGRGDSGIDVKPDWRPVVVTGGHSFMAIAAGQDAACALDLSGAAWCWGADDNGQLGLGAVATDQCFGYLPCSRYPLPVSGGHTFEKILSAGTTTCAVDGAGQVWCWGENEGGQGGAGGGSLPMLRTPTRALTSDSTVQLVAGDDTFCARYASGGVECWGINSSGEVGNPVGSQVRTPISPQTTELFVKLFAGSDGFCGRRADGATWCWGQINNSGSVPVRQAALDRYPVIGGDWRTDGQVLDTQGHLHSVYNGTFFDMGGNVRLTTLGSGAESGCGLGAGAQVWCWGGNSEGELGNSIHFQGNDYYIYPPVPVGGWYPAP